mmetsp:Transcript_91801/g.259850  ORF Transcript_91801/g.259850 Transcript_91801/m.259850 type:complete len:98 (+) Transcript_91801:118-411(+)
MSMRTKYNGDCPAGNMMRVYETGSWTEAHAWMCADKANRIVEGVQEFPLGHKQVCWERINKSEGVSMQGPAGIRWVNYFPEAVGANGCLHNLKEFFQ